MKKKKNQYILSYLKLKYLWTNELYIYYYITIYGILCRLILLYYSLGNNNNTDDNFIRIIFLLSTYY